MGAVFGIEEKVAQAKSVGLNYMAVQREVQMSVNIARTRDMVQWIGGVWTGLFTVGTLATLRAGKFPAPLAIPLIVLGIGGCYQADLAYGTKLRRVCKEAEFIMNEEKWRFIPPGQAPFAYVYDEEEDPHEIHRVGEFWPSPIRAFLEAKKSETK